MRTHTDTYPEIEMRVLSAKFLVRDACGTEYELEIPRLTGGLGIIVTEEVYLSEEYMTIISSKSREVELRDTTILRGESGAEYTLRGVGNEDDA